MNSKYYFIFIFTFKCFLFYGQTPGIEWQKCYGGSIADGAKSIQQTIDGGYIIAGETYSNDGDVSGNHDTTGSYYDFWILKINSIGSIQWQKCFGGSSYDKANSIRQTYDGGYIVAGSTGSHDGDVDGNNDTVSFHYDFWIIKLDSIGAIQWKKCFGGSSKDEANSIRQTYDGGYIVAGSTSSHDGDVNGNHDSISYHDDAWIIKLDSVGGIQWKKCFGGSNDDEAWSIQQTLDSGYIYTGTTFSNNGDVSGNHGFSDCWVCKLNSAGNIQWEKCLGGSNLDNARSIQQTIDGGYIIAGNTQSNDGDVSGNHNSTGQFFDYWIIKLNSIGVIKWQRCMGGSGQDIASDIKQTIDKGYIVSGWTQSNNGDVSGIHGQDTIYNSPDYWIVKIDSVGIIQWQKCLGGSGQDYAYSIEQSNDLGYIVAGSAQSNDGDVVGYNGGEDVWIVKIGYDVGINKITETDELKIYPNPSDNYITIGPTGNLIKEKSEIEIYNHTGQNIFNITTKITSVTIDISGFANGMYFIKIKNKNGVSVKKIIKE
jgi:hypothetical protein